jgi:PHS family inorganic phosphate transporter-like MFS transporter
MLAWVFFAQPVGQLLATAFSLAAVAGFRSQITSINLTCGSDDGCYRAIDRLWRLVIGLGAIPAIIALAFRFTIPESPRYKLDVQRNVHKVFHDTQDYYGSLKIDPEGGEMAQLRRRSPTGEDQANSGVGGGQLSRRASSDIAPDEVVESEEEDRESEDYHRQDVQIPPEDPSAEPPLASREDVKKFFIEEKNWLYLLGTSLNWLFLDFAFYGLGLSSPTIIRHIWYSPGDDRPNVYPALVDDSWHSLVMVSIGAIVGGAAMIKVIKYASPKVIQFWGFIVLFVLFIVTGSAWTALLNGEHQTGLIVLYVLCQIAFNLGPNVTTFIIPAEIFPTRYRCTCHGISAAAGKLGSWVAQIFLAFAFKSGNAQKQLDNERGYFGHVLQVMSAFMIAGAATTYFLIPETRDHDGKSRTLEELSGGRVRLQELNRQREREHE